MIHKQYFSFSFTDTPSIVLNPKNPVENYKAVFRCEANFRGPDKEQIPSDHLPYMTMFYAHDPSQELQAIEMAGVDTYNIIKVSNTSLFYKKNSAQMDTMLYWTVFLNLIFLSFIFKICRSTTPP